MLADVRAFAAAPIYFALRPDLDNRSRPAAAAGTGRDGLCAA